MLAIELDGGIIRKRIKVSYRFKTWAKARPDEVKEFTVYSVVHRDNATVSFNIGPYESPKVTIPWNAEVEYLSPLKPQNPTGGGS